jgi:hypothetical protein
MADKKEEKIKATSPVMAGPSNTSKTEERPKVAPAVVPSPLQSPSVAPATQWMGTSENIEVDPKMVFITRSPSGHSNLC